MEMMKYILEMNKKKKFVKAKSSSYLELKGYELCFTL